MRMSRLRLQGVVSLLAFLLSNPAVWAESIESSSREAFESWGAVSSVGGLKPFSSRPARSFIFDVHLRGYVPTGSGSRRCEVDLAGWAVPEEGAGSVGLLKSFVNTKVDVCGLEDGRIKKIPLAIEPYFAGAEGLIENSWAAGGVDLVAHDADGFVAFDAVGILTGRYFFENSVGIDAGGGRVVSSGVIPRPPLPTPFPVPAPRDPVEECRASCDGRYSTDSAACASAFPGDSAEARQKRSLCRRSAMSVYSRCLANCR